MKTPNLHDIPKHVTLRDMSLQLFTLHPQMEPVLLVGHIKALCEIATSFLFPIKSPKMTESY